MTRMTICIIMLGTGAAVCGYLVIRHARRTPLCPAVRGTDGEMRATPPASARTASASPFGDDMTGLRLKMKLRREEERQRPEEGRN